MSRIIIFPFLIICFCLIGCADTYVNGSPQLSPESRAWFEEHGYHTAPYDNTGNGPSETGMEGGGG
jgi:hypothetical protein